MARQIRKGAVRNVKDAFSEITTPATQAGVKIIVTRNM